MAGGEGGRFKLRPAVKRQAAQERRRRRGGPAASRIGQRALLEPHGAPDRPTAAAAARLQGLARSIVRAPSAALGPLPPPTRNQQLVADVWACPAVPSGPRAAEPGRPVPAQAPRTIES